jgi:hypothetical protein
MASIEGMKPVVLGIKNHIKHQHQFYDTNYARYLWNNYGVNFIKELSLFSLR